MRSRRRARDVWPLTLPLCVGKSGTLDGMANFNYDAVKDLLCCPKTRAALVYTGSALVSCDPEARLSYPVVDGFPVLLIDEATQLSQADWAEIMARHGRKTATGEPAADPQKE